MKYKRIEYTIDNLNDNDFNNILKDPFILKDFLDNEKKYLEEYNIKIIEINIESLYLIVEDNIKLHINMFETLSISFIKDCNKQGYLINEIDNKKNSILNNIKNSKIEFIKDYFKKNNIYTTNIKPNVGNAGLIEFNCPVCGKTNSKCYMMVDSFFINTHSKTDCTDEKHKRKYKTLTNKLRNSWKNRDNKENGIFSLSIEKIKETIDKCFPLILKHSISNELYYYDEEKKYYIEIEEKKNKNQLNTLIRNNFYIEEFNILFGLTVKQLNDIKNIIKDQILLNYAKPNPENYINLKNGIYDIEANILLPHSSDFFFTYKLPIEFKENINTKWLDELFLSWGLDLNIVKKYLGYTFQPSTSLEKMFPLIGESGAGKSTFLNMQQYIFGNKFISMDFSKLYSNFISLPPGKKIENATIICQKDLSEDFFLKYNPKLLIQMTSGEGVDVNIKHKETYYIEHNIAKISFACNNIPKVNSQFDNGGFDRRIYPLFFTKNWNNKIDENLFKNFINDEDKKSQYLSYILQGLEMFNNKTEIFFPIDKQLELERKKESEPLIEFLDDNFNKTNNWDDVIKFSDIMNKYENFRYENNYRYSITARTMKNKINEFFKIDKKFINYTVSIKGEKIKSVRYLKLKSDIPAKFENKFNENVIPFEKKDL